MADTVLREGGETMSLDQAEPRRSWRTALCWLALALCAVPLGCGKSGPPPEIVQARELLQVNKFQAAADLLANQKSAEGLYLKAVALHALRQPDAALDAVKKAHQLDQADPRYEGFLLLLRMMKDEQGAANELIDLYEQNRSVGALALFASSAYLMKRDQPKSMATFDVAVALANETPEFMWQMLDQALAVGRRKAAEDLIDKLSGVRPKDPDVLRRLLQTAVRGRLGPSAETLLTKLKELTPDDPQLEKKRVEVLFLLNRPEALTAAEKLYRDWGETEEAALVYILPLSEAPYSPENDRQFAALMRRFPRNMEIFARYTLYLAKADRLEDALDLIDRALSSGGLEGYARVHLLELAVGLPLEKERPDLLEREIERHRSEVTDPQLLSYLQGRLYTMRKEYEPALLEFKKVIETEKSRTGTPRAVAADSLVWVRRILADKQISQQLGKVAEAIEHLDDDGKPMPKEDKSAPTEDKPAPTERKPETESAEEP